MTAASGNAAVSRPIEVSAAGNRRVLLFCDPDMVPADGSVDMLRSISAHQAVAAPVAGLPDLHAKVRGGIAPTGYAAATDGLILRGLMDMRVNCGMSVAALSVEAAAANPETLDRWFGAMAAEIPARRRPGAAISGDEAAEIFARGPAGLLEKWGLPPETRERLELGGCLHPPGRTPDRGELRAALSERTFEAAGRGLGALGTGNHFLELHAISKVRDRSACEALGLSEGSLLLCLHSDSSAVGGEVKNRYGVRKEGRRPGRFLREFRRQFAFHLPRAGIGAARTIWRLYVRTDPWGAIEPDSREGRRFLVALYAAHHFGTANRLHILAAACRTASSAFGSMGFRLLSDAAHDSIFLEEHGGRKLWVHRKGAVRGRTRTELASDPQLRHTGQPLLIPGALGTTSFLAVVGDGCPDALLSVNHGSGRHTRRDETTATHTEEDVERETTSGGMRLYRIGDVRLAGESPRYYKDISKIAQTCEAFGLAHIVAVLKPIASLKG
ncbi:MAG: RtcB family protein [Planctomycetota bacterium]|nr:RtcB family protein [Planctomycetota bacterium]